MKKRVLAILCVLSILMGMVVMPATAAASDGSEYYQVGYSKMDINPWIQSDYTGGIGIPKRDVTDENGNYIDNIIEVDITHNGATVKQPMVSVPLSGYSNAWSRFSDSMVDDNGDGVVGIGDGLFTTCTVVVDPNGSMVFFFTLDAISGYGGITNAVRTAVVNEIADLGGTVTADRIMVTGSHSHTAPTMDELVTSVNATAAHKAYHDYIISQMTQAAVNAYNDSKNTQATMKRRELDVSEAYGYQMNWVRHVKVPLIEQDVYDYISPWFGTDKTETLGTGSLVYGSNFGFLSYTKTLEEELLKGTDWQGNSGNIGTRTRQLVVDTANRSHVAEADDTLRLLTFEFEDGRDPIALINWRGHPDNLSNKSISSDYIGSLRYRLEENYTKFGGDYDYRVGFYQGASGNINILSVIEEEAWVTQAPTPNGLTYLGNVKDDGHPINKYGYMLAEAALLNLEGSAGTTTQCDVGKIVNMQFKNFPVDQQIYTAEEKQAAKDLLAEVQKKNSSAGYTSPTDYIQKAGTEATFPYTGSTGGVLNSIYHWNKVYSQGDNPSATLTTEIGALMIGSNAAFVISACELFDRYDEDQSVLDEDNDWRTLVNDATYGTPFVLGYTNDHAGYISNTMAYHYNEGEEYTGYNLVGTGSYEANISVYAEGVGEKLIDQYGKMLSMLSSDSMTYKCQHCQKEVEWQPLLAADANTDLTSGHYVMLEDLKGTGSLGQQELGKTGKVEVCLDLNGYTYYSESRCAIIHTDSTLNIMNMVGVDGDGNPVENKQSGTGGMMVGRTNTNNPGGGTFYVNAGAIVNLYGGTLEFQQRDMSAYNGIYNTGMGAVFSLAGTLNMYGGTIHGSDFGTVTPYNTNGNYIGLGGAIYISNGATLDMRGGSITLGKVPTGGAGPCVYLAGAKSTVKLSGDASIDDIYYRYASGTAVTISGNYTGTTNLTFNDSNDTTFADYITLQQNMDIGDITSGADISKATLTFTNDNKYKVAISGTDLVLKGYADTTAAVIVDGTNEAEYASLGLAISHYTSNGKNYIKLIKTPNESAVTINKTVYLDLNGIDVRANITANAALYVMDSMTDDYTVDATNHTGYGKLTGTLTGDIKAVPVGSGVAEDGYLMVEEDDIGTSFHRVSLRITHMTLRAKSNGETEFNPDVFYECKDGGLATDKVAAKKIDGYGIAMSVDGVPTADSLTNLNSSYFEGYPGADVRGTLLTDVLKVTNNPLVNRRNANLTVYGSAYILTEDGYMFGECVIRTFKDQMEGVDTIWNTLDSTQKTETIKLYKTYSSLMSSWKLPNLRNEMISGEDKTISILGIGNSYTIDSMWMLGEVYQAENPGKTVQLGIAYKSGESLAGHVKNINAITSDTENAAVYNYFYWEHNPDDPDAGKWTVAASKMTLQDIIKAQQWEMVSMQQSSARSGDPSTYNGDIQTIQSYVENQLGYVPTYLWNMTWAYPVNDIAGDTGTTVNTSATFESLYGSSQATMYKKIVETVQAKIVPDTTFEYLMPVGTAIQNANATLDDPDLYRDNTHLSDFARLIAAYTWYCELEHATLDTLQLKALPTVNCSSNSWHNGTARNLTDSELTLVINSVKAARQSNFTTTDTSVYN